MAGALITLALVMIAAGAFWCAAGVVIMALALLRPQRMSDARALIELGRLTPGDLGLPFEEQSFEVIDEQTGRKLKIAAWWIANAESRGRCAVIVHGYGDAKIGGIAWAPLLASLRFSILAIDLRAHGESGGRYCSGGFWERHDLNQVIDQLRAARPEQTRQIVLFGVSLGAAVAAAAAEFRHDLAAVILESPYSDFRAAADYQADRLGAPKLLRQGSLALAEWIAGCDFAAVRPLNTIPKISGPLMVIQSGDDPFLSDEDRAAVRRAVESRPSQSGLSVYWELPGVHHVVGLRADPEEYRRRLQEFLGSALPSTVGICEK